MGILCLHTEGIKEEQKVNNRSLSQSLGVGLRDNNLGQVLPWVTEAPQTLWP